MNVEKTHVLCPRYQAPEFFATFGIFHTHHSLLLMGTSHVIVDTDVSKVVAKRRRI